MCASHAQAQALAAKKKAEKEEAAAAAIKAAAEAEATAAAGIAAAKKKPPAPKNIMLKGARMAFQSGAQPVKSPPANQVRLLGRFTKRRQANLCSNLLEGPPSCQTELVYAVSPLRYKIFQLKECKKSTRMKSLEICVWFCFGGALRSVEG